MQKVVLLTDQPVLSAGMVTLCEKHGSLELASVCSTLTDLRDAVIRHQPRLAMLDYRPDLEATQLREVCTSACPLSVVLIGRRIPPEFACQAREMGVAAVLSTTLSLDQLANNLRRILEGEILFEHSVADAFPAARRIRFTPRESELVMLLSYGLKNKEISARLGISEGTVKVYLSKLFDKVGARDRFELALFGLKGLGRLVASAPQDGLSEADGLAAVSSGGNDPGAESQHLRRESGTLTPLSPGPIVFH